MIKLLVIEDDEIMLFAYRVSLGIMGYSVVTARNGTEGLEKFKHEKPPVVLTDFDMPGMDGIEVLRQIKAEAPHTQVILASGSIDKELAHKAYRLGVTAVLSKPVEPHILYQALNQAKSRFDNDIKNEARAQKTRSKFIILNTGGLQRRSKNDHREKISVPSAKWKTPP